MLPPEAIAQTNEAIRVHDSLGQGVAEAGGRRVPAAPRVCRPPFMHRFRVFMPINETMGDGARYSHRCV